MAIGAARPTFCNSVPCAESIDCHGRAHRRALQKAKSAGQIGEPHSGCTKRAALRLHKVQRAAIEKAHSAPSTHCSKHIRPIGSASIAHAFVFELEEIGIQLGPPKNGEIALWLPTNRLMCSKYVSQKQNESIDNNQWYNLNTLLNFIL